MFCNALGHVLLLAPIELRWLDAVLARPAKVILVEPSREPWALYRSALGLVLREASVELEKVLGRVLVPWHPIRFGDGLIEPMLCVL
jgi:hypothetical protein